MIVISIQMAANEAVKVTKANYRLVILSLGLQAISSG